MRGRLLGADHRQNGAPTARCCPHTDPGPPVPLNVAKGENPAPTEYSKINIPGKVRSPSGRQGETPQK